MVLDPLVVQKLEVFVVGQIVEKYYFLRNKNRMPHFFLGLGRSLQEPANYLAEKLNSKVTDKDVLKSRLFERQKQALISWLLAVVDRSAVWLVTPARVAEAYDHVRAFRKKNARQGRFLMTAIARLASAPSPGAGRPRPVVPRARPVSALGHAAGSSRPQTAKSRGASFQETKTSWMNSASNRMGRNLIRSNDITNSTLEISINQNPKNNHHRAKSANLDKVPVSELIKQEKDEIIVLPTQIELNQAKKITGNICKNFKYRSQLNPSAALLARLSSPKRTVVSKEDFSRIFPRFNEASVSHLSTGQKELLKYTMMNDLNAVKQILSKLSYGDCDFFAKEIGPPLYWAVKNKNYEMTSLLLENGSNSNKPTKNGEISLHEACRKGCKDVYLK